MPPAPYPARLHAAVRRKSSVLVVGLDPRLERLPSPLLESARRQHGADPRWITEALSLFAAEVATAVASSAVALKVNIAYFERYHLPGLLAYPRALAAARRQGLLVIGDVKRGDIRESSAAYAAGHLQGPPVPLPEDQRLDADAVTVHPYLGDDAIAPLIQAARAQGRGIYVLVRTTNPSSRRLQELPTEGGTVAEEVARLVRAWGEEAGDPRGYSPVGAVVAATFPAALERLRRLMPRTPFLVPGLGAQGGRPEHLRAAFDPDGLGAVVSASRSIVYAYEGGGRSWVEAVAAAAARAREELEAVRRAL